VLHHDLTVLDLHGLEIEDELIKERKLGRQRFPLKVVDNRVDEVLRRDAIALRLTFANIGQCLDVDAQIDVDVEKDHHDAVNNGKSALHLACRNGNVNLVATLLEARARTEVQDSNDRTPLFDAVLAFNPRLVQMLLDARANAAPLDNGNPQRTPIEYALIPATTKITRTHHDMFKRNNDSNTHNRKQLGALARQAHANKAAFQEIRHLLPSTSKGSRKS